MSVLGIDLAAEPTKTYACTLDARDGRLDARLFRSCDDDRLLALAEGRARIGIDAPFGWPNAFVDAVSAHRDGRPWLAPPDGEPRAFRASLSFRATDRVVMQTRRPLSVSTDKLGVTAMRCAFLLDRWSRASSEPVDRAGRGRFVEVYPAGALTRWSLPGSGYKRRDPTALGQLLDELRARLPQLDLLPDDAALCAVNDDAFDALVAALIARAALLGLTDPPSSPALTATARQEGWIHLPVRGSLAFLAETRTTPPSAAARALAARRREQGAELTPSGYAERFEDALLEGVSPATTAAIEADLAGKGGSELVPRSNAPAKFHAAHSSAALAANVFGPFLREHDDGVPFGGETFTGSTHLEVRCPTGLGGTPPTLDCVVDGPAVLAVESKLTETFDAHHARFSDAYERAMASAEPGWLAEYERLLADPTRYRRLDAAQLIKHYLGLRTTFPKRPVTLAYLYWEPSNAAAVAAAAIHAAEVAEFTARVNEARTPHVRFVASSYARLWDDWAAEERPAWLRAHAVALRRRYDVAL